MTPDSLHSQKVRKCRCGRPLFGAVELCQECSDKMYTAGVDLQTMIDHKRLELATAMTPEGRRSAWNELQALIKSRPAHVVAAMDREKGLTR